jgi:hypothetical protein
MTDQPTTDVAADPLATPDAPPESPDVDPRDAAIAELKDAVALLQQSQGTAPPAAPTVPGATGGSAPAAVAPGVPAHAMAANLDDAEIGDLYRYVIPSLDGTSSTSGYGLVLDVVTVDDATLGTATDGNPSHVELVVAELNVLGRRLTASEVVDLDASTAVHEQQG